MPFTPDLIADDLSPALFTLLLVIWISTSSVLRAPPLVLLIKHAAGPKSPRLAALSLFWLGFKLLIFPGAAAARRYGPGAILSLGLGTSGREGLVQGLWFTMISLTTLTRAGLVAGGVKSNPEHLEIMTWAPGALWVPGGLTLLTFVYLTKKERQ